MRSNEVSTLISPPVIAAATWMSRRVLLRRHRVSTAGFLALAVLIVGPAVAEGEDEAVRPRIAPISGEPGGQSYGRWAAEWWQWALGVPAATTVFDEGGENCTQRQVGDTWFLAGSFGSEAVVRECTIPEGKALFIPLVNKGSFAFLTDEPEERTEEFLREQAACELPVQLFAEIDGFEIRGLRRLFTGRSGSQSPLFNIQLPPENLLGAGESDIPELVLSPSAEQGFYLYVRPLPPGEHVVHWEAEGCSDTPQDITYQLTIVPAEDAASAERGAHAERPVGGFRLPGDFRRND